MQTPTLSPIVKKCGLLKLIIFSTLIMSGCLHQAQSPPTYKHTFTTYHHEENNINYPAQFGNVQEIKPSAGGSYYLIFDNQSDIFKQKITNNYQAEPGYALQSIHAHAYYHPPTNILFYNIDYNYLTTNQEPATETTNTEIAIFKNSEVIFSNHVNNLPSSGKTGISTTETMNFRYITSDNRYLVFDECTYFCVDVKALDLQTFEQFSYDEMVAREPSFQAEHLSHISEINTNEVTFLPHRFLKDNHQIFFNQITHVVEVPGLDTASFKPLFNSYVSDKNGIYHFTNVGPTWWEIHTVSHTNDIENISPISNDEYYNTYALYHNQVYQAGKLLPGATKECYKDDCYGK